MTLSIRAVARIEAERERFWGYAEAWRKQGFSEDEIVKLEEPLESFHMQLAEEVDGQGGDAWRLFGLGMLEVRMGGCGGFG